MRVLGISGSLRAGSYNTQLLRAAAEVLPDGVKLELYDGLRELPPYDQDVEDAGAPPAVQRLRGHIAGAAAVLIATPEYNGSLPGLLKNAIDWASRPRGEAPLLNKPVAVVGASTGAFGGVWAQADTRKILGIAGARVVEGEVAIGHAPDKFAGGVLVDPEHRAQLGELMRQLATAVELRIANAA
jgi:chromate reductase